MILSQATITGRSHRLMQQNGHDFAVTGAPRPGVAFGLVLDGCGSKQREVMPGPGRPHKLVTPSHNEVGAKLLGQFAATWLAGHLAGELAIPLLLAELYRACLAFLAGLAGLLPFPGEAERNRFVASHLLCTLLGFVVTPAGAALFSAGDGYFCQDGQVTFLDCDNRPDYLAYQLLGWTEGHFHIQMINDPAALPAWLAVATDGWPADLLAGLAQPRSSLALQRWLNVQAQQRGRFEDDGAVAAWYTSDLETPITNYQLPNYQLPRES
ncbi:MAG: protein phosphatase 2C domain-containing protein [Chloroflexi bacterium]|nr:protein phosphatase 2C domain-containing protein [Chloroflexota bacterium]MCI0577903.1 protein phosphatase 2C domain-containing protein [Chloroflexota bacterium]MCI0643510.1 protein phosphatase 2C domain-containing protein [Chloroflexota bacterium]MCI0726618.1 protein phosphatase 2C domain-containing protein [Chloroflexota bacterium]